MALLFFEGFDHQKSDYTDMPVKGYTYTLNFGFIGLAKAAGQLGGSAMLFNIYTGTAVNYALGANYVTLVAGFRFQFTNPADPTAPSEIFKFLDGSSAQVGLSINTTRRLVLWRGSISNVIATSTQQLTGAAWHFIELKITFDNAGTYEVKLGGVTEMSGSADTQNTANAYATGFAFCWENSTIGSPVFDDFYICDTTGGAPHNNFLGVIRIETAYATSNNSVTWTPLSSTNVSNVDETINDGDTTYNSTSTGGNVDTYNHGAISSTPVTIFGVSVITSARKDDVTARQVRTKLISGGTTQNGTATFVDSTYKYIRDQYIQDPDTAAAWTESGVNATKIGYEHV